jgi:ribosome-associated translation inhibitor RaiA
MLIQVRTDDHIQGGQSLADQLELEVSNKLGRYAEVITRVDIHVSDLDAGKAGSSDKRVVLEAHLGSRPALVVNAEADKVAEALGSALTKLLRVIDHDLGKLKDRAGRHTIRNPSAD